MATPEQLRRQAGAVARVRAARTERDKAVETTARKLRKAILDAVSTGAAVRDIALAAGLSVQRIYQVIAEERQSGE